MNADLSSTLCTDHAAQGWDHCDCSPARVEALATRARVNARHIERTHAAALVENEETATVVCDQCGARHQAVYSHEGRWNEGAIFAVICPTDGLWLTDYYTAEVVTLPATGRERVGSLTHGGPSTRRSLS